MTAKVNEHPLLGCNSHPLAGVPILRATIHSAEMRNNPVHLSTARTVYMSERSRLRHREHRLSDLFPVSVWNYDRVTCPICLDILAEEEIIKLGKG